MLGALSRLADAGRILLGRNPIGEARTPPNATPLAPPSQKQVARAGFEYGVAWGGTNRGVQVTSSQERTQILTQLHQAYLTCPWVSAPVDLIARTVTAGGLQVVTDDEIPDGQQPFEPPELARLRRLLRFTNPHEDLVQLLRNVTTDLMLFGDAFLEVVYLLKEPVALYTLDAVSMTAICNEHGEVTGYQQNTDTGKQADFDLNQVIHVSLDAPRGGIYGVAPAQKALLPTTAWLFAEACIKENFRRGDPAPLHVDLAGYTDREAQIWREQYTVYNLGPKSIGTPIVTRNGSQVQGLNPRKVTDYLDASRQLRDEIISCFGVPPAKLGIIESGNLGGGTGESQDRTLRINTVLPIQSLILEKLNYHLVQQGYGITGWHLEFDEVDYRDSEVVEKIRDMRVRNGSYTVNRYRDEIGEPPVDGGENAVIIDRQNMVLVRDLEAASQAGIAAKLKGTALEPAEPAQGKPMSIEKPEPEPVPAALAPFAGQQQQPPVKGGPQPGQQPPGGPPGKDRPGGPDDAAVGTPPREDNRYRRDFHALTTAWEHAYRQRRRIALEALPTPPDLAVAPDPGTDQAVDDPYLDPAAHPHNDKPDYTPQELGVDALTRVIVDPRDTQVDHSYQRKQQPKLVARYAAEPRQRLAQRVGLLAKRPDGSLWVVDGQHHTAAAVQVGITALTYQQFDSTGPRMEAEVYRALHRWHQRHHRGDRPSRRRRQRSEPGGVYGGV